MNKDNQTKELSILTCIEQNFHATQREISERVGISLGTVNILLKQMVRKGFVKIERMRPNAIKYFLTPAGFANKVERTHNYVVRTFREILSLRERITAAADRIAETYHVQRLVFFGDHDEFSAMIRDLIKVEAFGYQVRMYTTVSALLQDIESNKENPVVVWDDEKAEILEGRGLVVVNMLKVLEL